MKPFTVVMGVRPVKLFGKYKSSGPVYVYGTDKDEAVERARRVLEMELWDCAKEPDSVKEGWPRNVSQATLGKIERNNHER